MSKSDPKSSKSCNRRPFLSGDGCDRGNVDIHQFDDFPYCESFDPTMPAIPPEIVDTPLQIPVPPSCACVNIKYALKFKYSQNRKFEASASFSAQGDCCEGNYVSNFNLQIPCPILGSGAKRLKMKISYGTGRNSVAASYIKTNADSCTVEAKDVDINLNIPCPIKDARGKKIKIGISYGNGKKEASASFLKTDPDKCTVEALAPTFNLNLPCPVRRQDRTPKIKAKIGWGNRGASASASLLSVNVASCEIQARDVNLNLNLPCPVRAGQSSPKIKAKIKWGNSGQSASASFLTADPSSCEIKGTDAVLNLSLPCPIRNSDHPPKLKAKIGWGSNGKSASVSILTADPNSCEIRTADATLSLNLPCPIMTNATRKISITPKIGNTTGTTQNVNFITLSKTNCTVDANDVSLNLTVPCPFTAGTKTIKINSLQFGVPTPVTKNLATLTNCNVAMESPEFSLNVPCALQNIKIQKGTVTTAGSTGTFNITDTGQPAHASCSRTFTIDVNFPKGGGTLDIDKDFVVGIRYNASRHALQVKTFNPKKNSESGWYDVFGAVSHKSDHMNCNDV